MHSRSGQLLFLGSTIGEAHTDFYILLKVPCLYFGVDILVQHKIDEKFLRRSENACQLSYRSLYFAKAFTARSFIDAA